MENKKMTKREYFGVLREIVIDRPELVAFIDHELGLLEKKVNSSKMTSTQKENETIKGVIVETLGNLGRYAAISERGDGKETLGSVSKQKISALLKQLVDTEIVEKQIDKKKNKKMKKF
jgi:hypothetical protein